jgi:hypothetical protein
VGKNKQIFQTIREKLDVANKELGLERGEAPDAQSEILFEDDSGNSISVKSSDFVNVIRDGEEMSIRACAVLEGDDLRI